MRALSGGRRRTAQWITAAALLAGLGLLTAGGLNLIAYAQTSDLEQNVNPGNFDFVVTVTPVPAQGLALSRVPAKVNGPPAPAAAAPAPTAAHAVRPTVGNSNTSADVVAQADTPSPVPTEAPTDTPAPSPTPAPPAEVPTRIVIPSIRLDAPITPVQVVQQSNDPALAWGVPDAREAGWLNTTARLGEPGNLVLDGHHNEYGLVFAYLKDLKPGALIYIYGPGQVMTYTLTERHLLLERGQPLSILEQHARYIEPTSDTRLTLVTCWPPNDNSHRLILIARPVADASNTPPAGTSR